MLAMAIRFRNTTHIKAPVETLWNLVVDVERWPDFLPTMGRVEIQNERLLAPGSRVLIKQPLLPENVWTVLALDRPHLFRWRTGRGWLALIATHQLEPIGDTESLQTLTLEIEGRLAWVAALAAGWALHLALWLENRGFRERAESLSGR